MDKCRSTEIHEVKYRSLEVVPTGSDTFQAPSVGRCIALRGSALDDLREFVATANAANASGQDDPLGDLRDLGGQHGRGGGASSSSGSRGAAGRGSGRGQISSAGSSKDKGDLASGPQRADVAEEEATLEEYAHEAPLKEMLMKELRSLKEYLSREGKTLLQTMRARTSLILRRHSRLQQHKEAFSGSQWTASWTVPQVVGCVCAGLEARRTTSSVRSKWSAA